MYGLSNTTYNALRRAGIITLDQLKNLSNEEIVKIRGIGMKSFNEIMILLDRPEGKSKLREDLEKIFMPKFLEVR